MKKEEIKKIIENWQFVSCPTEEKDPFFWKWNERGLEMLILHLQEFEIKVRRTILEEEKERFKETKK